MLTYTVHRVNAVGVKRARTVRVRAIGGPSPPMDESGTWGFIQIIWSDPMPVVPHTGPRLNSSICSF